MHIARNTIHVYFFLNEYDLYTNHYHKLLCAATFIATKFLQNLAHASLVSKVCIWERDEGVADPWSIVTGKSGFDKLF